MKFSESPFPIIRLRGRWYLLSLALILPGLIGWAVWGLNYGIDFKGGTLQQLTFPAGRPEIETVRAAVAEAGITGAQVQTAGDTGVLVRFPNTDTAAPRAEGNTVINKLKGGGRDVTEAGFETIGGSVARDTSRKAVTAVILTVLAIIAFIAFSFRSVPKPASSWKFALTVVAALGHDILFVIGAFALIGHYFPRVEVDALFITALLTVLGFSVNDTIVVFDRVRENLIRTPLKPFAEVANDSLNQTLVRSFNTSMTVLIVLISLLLLGGEPIRNFILALTLGVAVGTYSSIFNAVPLLVSWQGRAVTGGRSSKMVPTA